MIAMKNAASGATYIPAARITRMAARSRRWLATDKAMADRARTGPSTPSHNAESTLNHCASVGSASVSHANKKPSENCHIKNTARMTMTMRRTPSVLSGQFLGMYDIATALLWSQADAFADLICKPICKPTAQHSMTLGITNRDHRTRNAKLEHTLRHWTAPASMRIIELENRCTGNRTVG